jgi:nicotinamidase-related amidase
MILVVIDMQNLFVRQLPNSRRVINYISKEIESCIQQKYPIVFVEYCDEGKTIPELTNITIGYRNTYHITKYEDDGSDAIKRFISKKRINYSKLRITGVNYQYCVLKTVCGLRDKYDIEIVDRACSTSDVDHEEARDEVLSSITHYNNVCVVNWF